MKRLVDENILSYDAARFWNEYSGFVDCWRDAYQEIEERYAAIVLSEKQMDEYRVMRRKARGRVVGGGFGVSGALKGMATAGAINAAAGAAHMMFNGAGKIVSDMRASSIKKEIFNNPNTKSSLADAAFQSAFQCHYALIACIKDNIPSFPCGCVTPEDAEQSYIRFENLKHLANDPSKVLHALMDIWKLNPYNTMCYDLMLSLLGDADGQLESLAAHFGYDLSTQKRKLLEKRKEQLSVANERVALLARDQLYQEADRLGLPHSSEPILSVEAVLKEFDREARTVDGIVLKTREDAALAAKELQEIRSAVYYADCDDKEEVGQLLKQFEQYKSPVAKKHMNDLQKKYEQILQKEKQVDLDIDGIPVMESASSEQAETAQEDAESTKSMLKNSDLEDLDSIRQARDAVNVQIISPDMDVASQEMLQEKQDPAENRIKCTFFGKQYPSLEEKQRAEEAYQDICIKLSSCSSDKDLVYIYEYWTRLTSRIKSEKKL